MMIKKVIESDRQIYESKPSKPRNLPPKIINMGGIQADISKPFFNMNMEF